MVITWKVEITPIDIPSKEASIKATRTDSADPDNPRIYMLPSRTLSNQAKQLLVLNEIWNMHQAALDLEIQIENFLVNLETQAKNNLEARE